MHVSRDFLVWVFFLSGSLEGEDRGRGRNLGSSLTRISFRRRDGGEQKTSAVFAAICGVRSGLCALPGGRGAPLAAPTPLSPVPPLPPTIETKSLMEGRSIHSSATYNPTVLPLTHVLTHFGRSKKRMTSLRARFRVLPVAVFSRQPLR